MIRLETFPDDDALAGAAAEALAAALAAPGARSFVATGGTTPGPTYDRLADRDLSWGRLTITLTDERWVDPSAPESNEALVRRRLLQGRAATAAFLPLKGAGASPEADAAAAEPGLGRILPSAAVLLGMGADGHVASLFPGAPAPPAGRLCFGVDEAGLDPRVPRISLTTLALLRSGLIVVLITGEAKRAVVKRIADDPLFAPPAAVILRQEATPVRVLWAP